MSIPAAPRNRSARRLLGDCRATAAVEFALILPLLLLLYIGLAEAGDALTADRKADKLASAIGDLIAQNTDTSNSAIDSLLAITQPMLAPYDDGAAEILIADIKFVADGENPDGSARWAPVVRWAHGQNTILPVCGDDPPIEIPEALIPTTAAAAGVDIIIARVVYPYTSPFADILASLLGDRTLNLEHAYILRPRASASVANSSATPC
jgi:Flp pilus assembly protein TadG